MTIKREASVAALYALGLIAGQNNATFAQESAPQFIVHPSIAKYGRLPEALNQKPSLVNAPITAMTCYFSLTDDQANKIEAIQRKAPDLRLKTEEVVVLPRGEGTLVTRPDGSTFRTVEILVPLFKWRRLEATTEDNAKMQAALDHAEKEIELLLTPEHRPKIRSFLRDLELFENVRLPPELIRDLDLNGPQKRKLQIIGQEAKTERDHQLVDAITQRKFSSIAPTVKNWKRDVREKAYAVLTTPQQAILEKWDQEHQEEKLTSPQRAGV